MTLVEQALAVAKKYPCFPTTDKRPTWSNAGLGVKRGEGGYKVATQDPTKIRKLFQHPRAREIAVPMGAMSGLLCIDVDLYKDSHEDRALGEWMKKNHKLLATMAHQTRSGGLHFIYKHPGDDVRFPATLRPGVDVKAGGNGYVCWPPTTGYVLWNKLPVKAFPMALLEDALKAKGGSGATGFAGSYNADDDATLIDTITHATDLYPALRTLSFRMPTRNFEDGSSLTQGQQVEILENIMLSSIAAVPGHPRHDDWQDRFAKIRELVVSANEKHARSALNAETARLLAEGPSFIDRDLIAPID